MTGPVNVHRHIRKSAGSPYLHARRRPDTRHLFRDFTNRKTDWEEMDKHAFVSFDKEHQVALLALPRKRISNTVSIWNAYFSGRTLEWVVTRGGRTYYVNTEGFSYARYGFEITGFPG